MEQVYGLLIDGENYSVDLMAGFYEFSDGSRIKVEGYNSTKVLVRKELATGIKQYKPVKMIIKYACAEGEEMTPEGYGMAHDMLETNHRLNPNDLDSEFAYRKFKAKWHPVESIVDVKVRDFDIATLYEAKSTHPNPYVMTSFSQNIGHTTAPYCTIDQGGITASVLREECAKRGLECVIDGNRDLNWAKIRYNGKDHHPFYNRTIYSSNVNVPTNEVDARIELIEKHTRDLVKTFILQNISPVEIAPNSKTSKDVLEFLDSVYSSVSGLEVKQKYYTSHRGVCNRISVFRNDFIKSIQNKEHE